jgi:hypothetical protein
MMKVSVCNVFVLVLAHMAMYQGAWGQSTLIYDSTEDINTILQLHNDYRAIHQSPPLVWSSSLASGAAQWASQCRWEHSNAGGENLFAAGGYPVDTLYTYAGETWYSEVSAYDFNNPQNSDFWDIGHFTQMVWASTSELGCARAMCPGGQNSPFGTSGNWLFVVCRYSPPGNMFAANGDEYLYFRQNVKSPAKAAPIHKHIHPRKIWTETVY